MEEVLGIVCGRVHEKSADPVHRGGPEQFHQVHSQ